MKKVLFVVAIMLGMAISSPAWAITIDGVAGAGEWSIAKLQLTDPDETGVPPVGVPQNYDDHYFWVADGMNLDFAFELYGTPTFVGEDGVQGNPAFYQVYLDFTNDGNAEYRIGYHNTGVTIDRWTGAWTQVGTGTGAMNSIVEFEAPGHFFSEYAPVCQEKDVWIRAYVDGGGNSNDDDIPDRGPQGHIVWEHGKIHMTPEPGSMALLGLGLLGFVGRMRRKFMA